MQQTFALSVGEPVKNLETSELNEFVALIPMTMSTYSTNEQSQRNNFIHSGFQGVCASFIPTCHTRLRAEMKLASTMTVQ